MKKFNLSDRESLEIGIVRHQPLEKIGLLVNKNTSSISREIKNHRIFVAGSYYAGNDCRYAKGCTKRHLCGDNRCPMYCYACSKDCHKYCEDYYTTKCKEYNKPPYVCNGYKKRRYCQEDRYFYDARVADKSAHERRKKKERNESGVLTQRYRQGRSYQDFLTYMESHFDGDVVEMDTVKGCRGKGKVLLTMLFRRNSLMLIFIIPDCKAESVIDRHDEDMQKLIKLMSLEEIPADEVNLTKTLLNR